MVGHINFNRHLLGVVFPNKACQFIGRPYGHDEVDPTAPYVELTDTWKLQRVRLRLLHRKTAQTVRADKGKRGGDHAFGHRVVIDMQTIGKVDPEHEASHRAASHHPATTVVGQGEADPGIIGAFGHRLVRPQQDLTEGSVNQPFGTLTLTQRFVKRLGGDDTVFVDEVRAGKRDAVVRHLFLGHMMIQNAELPDDRRSGV